SDVSFESFGIEEPDTGGAGTRHDPPGSPRRGKRRGQESSLEGSAQASGKAAAPGNAGSGATTLEQAAALATVVTGSGEVNFEAEETSIGVKGGLGLLAGSAAAAVLTAYLVAKEVAIGAAFGVAGRLLGSAGNLLRRLGAERIAGRLDELAEA